MKSKKSLIAAVAQFALASAVATTGSLAASSGLKSQDTKTLNKAQQVLDTLTTAPDSSIPNDLLARAECIAVFPSVTKGAFIVGGKYGRGVVTCRQDDRRMGPPAFFTISGASVGWQIGGQKADFVMLVMNDDGMQHLLKDKFTIGGEASATAGPVGRTAQASTDLQLQAQILSWSRSRGLFAGLALDGAVIKPNDEANARLYGHDTMAREILMDTDESVPVAANDFVGTARRVSEPEAVQARQ